MEINSKFHLIPTEIRQEIFENLDKEYLFQCLMVNRQWCRDIVTILWRSPLQDYKSSCEVKRIISVYVGIFSKETWDYLRMNGVSRPRNVSTPIFNYASFLEHYEPHSLLLGAGIWLKQRAYNPTQNQLKKRKALASCLYRLFFLESRSIRSFYYDFNEDEDFWNSIPRECSTKLLLRNLKELRITGFSNQQTFFENLAQVCHSIRGISISSSRSSHIENDNMAKTIRNAIKAQNELQWLQLRNLSNTNVKLICSTLYSASKTLRAIRFDNINFNSLRTETVIEGMSPCVNLLCLEFSNCTGIDQQSWIETAKYLKRLECLTIRNSWLIPLDFVKQVVITSGENLQYLRLESSFHRTIANNSINIELLSTLSQHSHNFRAISLTGLDVVSAILLIKLCPELEHLDIYTANLQMTFNNLIGKLSASVNSIGIHLTSSSHNTALSENFHKEMASNCGLKLSGLPEQD
ncbi:603_t:CDS:2, partial [Ambispora leptoticha]